MIKNVWVRLLEVLGTLSYRNLYIFDKTVIFYLSTADIIGFLANISDE
eukprot:UN12363